MNNSIYRNNNNRGQTSDFLNSPEDMNKTRRSDSPMSQIPSKPTRPYPNVQSSKPKKERYGMSSGVWDVTLAITETALDIIKAVMVVGGIISANLADVLFGAVGITILFGGSSNLFNGTPVWIIGLILSMGASAIQIVLWSMIQKRDITFYQIFHWKKLPSDVRGFLLMAFTVWTLDTLVDVSPVALLVQNSEYETIAPLYVAMIVAVSVIVFILCGFSEIMTSNMRSLLTGGGNSGSGQNQPSQSSQGKRYNSETKFPVGLPRK